MAAGGYEASRSAGCVGSRSHYRRSAVSCSAERSMGAPVRSSHRDGRRLHSASASHARGPGIEQSEDELTVDSWQLTVRESTSPAVNRQLSTVNRRKSAVE